MTFSTSRTRTRSAHSIRQRGRRSGAPPRSATCIGRRRSSAELTSTSATARVISNRSPCLLAPASRPGAPLRGGGGGLLDDGAAHPLQQRPVDADRPLEHPQRREEAGAQREERSGADPAADGEDDRRERDGAGVADREAAAAHDRQQDRHRYQREEERRFRGDVEVETGLARTLAQPFAELLRTPPHEQLAPADD